MRKRNVLMAALFSLGMTTANAQIGLVYGFSPTTGGSGGPVVLSGGTLYGVAEGGGANQLGCVYSVDTDGTGYKDLLDFNGANGNDPGGTLVLSGSTLYGITMLGGANDSGCIFSVNTNGGGYADLHNFTGADGNSMNDFSGLTLSGSVLYGMTESGGAHHSGVVFSVNTNGTGYTDLLDLDATTGTFPIGLLTFENGVLYGETSLGGKYSSGDIFRIKANGTGFRDLYNFNPNNSIYGNDGYLTPLRNKLYGIASQGGAHANGGIFSIDTNGSGFTDLYDLPFIFSDARGSVTLVGGVFFVVSSDGGSNVNSAGAIFSIDTSGSGFRELYDFDGTYGSALNGSLIYSKDKLYGTAEGGGPQQYGTIFKYDTNVSTTGVNELIAKSEEVRIYPNPSNGKFTLVIASVAKQSPGTVEIYNMLGEKVYSQLIVDNSQLTINLSGQSNGVYLYRVINTNGALVGEGKIEIQK